MSCGNQSDINQTFIVEPVTSESVLSGCNGIFTNILSSCSGDTSILLGTGGIFINGAVSATTYYGDGSNLTGIISAFRPDVGAFTLVSLQDDVNFPNIALGDFGFAIGQSTQANGFVSYAEGSGTIALGNYTHAEGILTQANGIASHAEGANTQANGQATHAGGFQSIANGDFSFVHGSGSLVNGLNSVVLGANLTGASDNTTYVDNFNIRTIGLGAPVTTLGIDVDGNVVSGTTAVNTGTTLNINGNEYDLSTSREWVVAQGSTGVLEYEGAFINSGATINVGAVKGYVVDNETNPLVPNFIFLDYSGETNVTVTSIGGGLTSYVLLKSDNTLLFQNTFPTSKERKENILLSKVAHSDGIVTAVVNEPDFILSPNSQLRDLFKPIKYINEGVFPYPNGVNLFVNISGGYIFGNGVNFVVDNENPNQVPVGPDTPTTFVYRTQTGGTSTAVSAITPSFYDVGGVITPITGAATTIQWVFSVPSNGIIIQFGQTLFALQAQALEAIGKESFVVFPDLIENAILIGVLIVDSTATDLSDTSQARFLRADKFGQIGGSQAGVSTSTLQTAYNNSTQPQLVINPVGGAIQIKGYNNFNSTIQGLNTANTPTFSVDGFGNLSATTLHGATGGTIGLVVGVQGLPPAPGTFPIAEFNDQTGFFSDWNFRVAGGGSPILNFMQSTGTLQAPNISNNNGQYGQIVAWGYSTGYTQTAVISLSKDGTPNTASTPSRITFTTTPVGSLTQLERFRIDNQGQLTINATPSAGTTSDSLLVRTSTGLVRQVPSTSISFTGGTVTGATKFTNGLTANTISATTYLGLPSITGGTLTSSANTITFTNNTGGTFAVTGVVIQDVFVNNTGGTPHGLTTELYRGANINLTGSAVQFVTSRGVFGGIMGHVVGAGGPATTTAYFQLFGNDFNGGVPNVIVGSSFSANTNTPALSFVAVKDDNYLKLTAATQSLFRFHNGYIDHDLVLDIKYNDFVYPKYPTSRVDTGTSVNFLATDNTGRLISRPLTSITLTGGTVTGATYFSGGLSANTISATTYLGLPTDIRVTGGTYTAGTTTLTNNTGGTVVITGYTYIPHLEYDNTYQTVWNNGKGNIYENTSFGESALTSNVSGVDNVAIGTETLAKMVNGNSNVGVGAFVLSNNGSGSSNTGVGDGALYSGTGSFNTLIGAGAGLNMTTPNSNTGVGAGVMQNLRTGIRNTAMGDTALGGSSALLTGVTGNLNIALGFKAGNAVTSGSGNILIENKSGNTVGGVTVGHNNIIIDNVDKSGIVVGSGNTIIGGFNNTIADGSNQVIIGTGYGARRLEIDSTGAAKFYGSLSATSYLNLPPDVYVTGGTYSSASSTIIFRNTTGGTFNVTGITASGGTGGGSGVSLTTTITINGVTQNLAANREWLTLQGNTGILNFNSGLTLNNSTAGTINISAMYGYIVDNETNPAIPTFVFVNYAGSPVSGVTVTTRNSGQASYVLLNTAGTPIFQNTFPTSAERKQNIWLGKIAHPASGTITTVINEPDFLTSPQSQVSDFFQAINYINDGVYPYFSGANLSFNITNGNIHGNGINLHNSRLIPNELQMGPVSTGTSFVYRTRTGGTSTAVSAITPGFYDNNGAITPVGGGVNTSTIQWIFAVPGAGFVVQYGQIQYTTLASAIAAIGREQFVVFPNLIENAILIGVVAVNKLATNLSDSTQAQFFRADKFGQIIGAAAGVSTTNLQAAYDNSLQPQLTISTTLGALQIKATTPNTPVFQILNSASTIGVTINGGGAMTANTFFASTYQNLPFVTGGTVTSGGTATFGYNTGATFSASGFQTIARLQNNMNFDGTGNLYPSVDAVNIQANQIFLASLETGMINRDGTFRMAINNPTTISVTGTTDGVLIRSLITGTTKAPSAAIKQIPNFTLPTSVFDLSSSGNGRYLLFLGYNYVNNSIISGTTDFNNSDTIAHLGYVELLRNGVTNTILALSTNPEISGYDNLTQLTTGYRTDVKIRPNPNLSVRTNSGSLLGMSVNWDGTNNDLKPISGSTSLSFTRIDPSYRITTGGFVPSTAVTVSTYWNGSALVPLTTPNSASIQRWIMMLDGRIFLQAGETVYANKAEADAAVNNGTFTFSPIFPANSFVELAIMVAIRSTTDLSDTTDAQIYDVGTTISSSSGGGEIPTMQNVYDVSTPTQILTDATRGALTIKSGTGLPDAQSFLFEGENSGGTRTSFIRADGAISGTTYFGLPLWSAGTGQNAVSQKFSNSIASGALSIAEGSATTSSGQFSHAEGFNTIAGGESFASHAEGYVTTATGSYGAHSEGAQTFALGRSSHAEGESTVAGGEKAHAEGIATTASGSGAHAEGQATLALGESSHAEGVASEAHGLGSHAEGSFTVATGQSSHAEGEETDAFGDYSHAEGIDTHANGAGSHAEGISGLANGEGSHSEGFDTRANGTYSHAEGANTIAGGSLGSHAEGYQSAASGESSHSEGSLTQARGNWSHAEGRETQNDGVASHVEGFNTYASGGAAHAEGNGTSATGNQSHAEGTSTTAGGENSHAGGLNSFANGPNSFVHGSGSTAGGTNTIVLGGNIIGNTNNTTYVDRLNVKTLGAGSSVNNLGVDSGGNVVVGTSGGGGGGADDDYFLVTSFRGLYNF